MANAPRQDPYEALGISPDASDADIKRAYRALAKRYHPDRNPGDAQAEAKFKQVGEAYEILSDPQKRSEYDRYGSAGTTRSRPNTESSSSDSSEESEEEFWFRVEVMLDLEETMAELYPEGWLERAWRWLKQLFGAESESESRDEFARFARLFHDAGLSENEIAGLWSRYQAGKEGRRFMRHARRRQESAEREARRRQFNQENEERRRRFEQEQRERREQFERERVERLARMDEERRERQARLDRERKERQARLDRERRERETQLNHEREERETRLKREREERDRERRERKSRLNRTR